jgi:hypothetical protein
VSDILFLAPYLLVPLVIFSVLPAFFGRFFFILAVAACFWIGSMNHGPDSSGPVYGMIAFCVALAAVLAEGVHFGRRVMKRRRLSHG